MSEGTIKTLTPKGFGFIAREGEVKDLFFHSKELKGVTYDELKVGDKVTIIWEQRQYEYTIYSTVTGTHVSDYNANLILYTCQLWNSPVRIFIYANRSN